MKKLLPPTLFVLFIFLMGFICWSFQLQHYIVYPLNLIGLPLVIIGLFVAQNAKKSFNTQKTNVNTFDTPDKLITNGFFKYSRNPMYLGFVIALTGFALLYQGSVSSFLLILVFFIITDRWYIKFEEHAMLNTFGEDYTNYCQQTRRWI